MNLQGVSDRGSRTMTLEVACKVRVEICSAIGCGDNINLSLEARISDAHSRSPAVPINCVNYLVPKKVNFSQNAYELTALDRMTARMGSLARSASLRRLT